MLGPTLLDLTERLKCSATMASLLFSARAGAQLGSMEVSGRWLSGGLHGGRANGGQAVGGGSDLVGWVGE